MLTSNRVYISVPNDHNLRPEQLEIKRGIIDRIISASLDPQELFYYGEFSKIPWSYENVQYKLGRCQGAVILGLIRWEVRDEQKGYKFNTAYNHFEGALALAKDLPSFILMHEHVHKAGIALKGRAQFYVKLPDRVDASWLQTETFLSKFNMWVEAVKERRQIFLAYTPDGQVTATKIKDFLAKKGVSVMDWAVGRHPFTSRLNEIEKASRSCLGSIFVFANDGEMIKNGFDLFRSKEELIFAAGYFMHSKGKDKTLIIGVEDAFIPAAVDEAMTLPLENREELSTIEKDLDEFIEKNI